MNEIYFSAIFTGSVNCARRIVAPASEAMMAPPFKSIEATSFAAPSGRLKVSVSVPLPEA